MASRRILITGAAGLLGAELVARLSGRGHRVIALVHRARELVRNNRRRIRTDGPGGVTCLAGDITRPRLGLSADEYDRLRTSVDLVLHSAAVTDFGRDLQLYRDVNVRGTAHAIELARDTPRGPVPFVHVSTAYVCGERRGLVREDELDVGQRFGNPYERSKLDAEILLRDAAATGLPTVVARPSIIVGTARAGVIRDFKNIYVVLKLITAGRVRSIPGNYDALLDLVPLEYVASSIVALTEAFERVAGGTFHVIGGLPLSLRDFSDVLAEYPSFQVPRFVPPPSFDRESLPTLERLYYDRVVGLYESYFRRRVHFSNEATLAQIGRKAPPGGPAFLRRLLGYCLRVGYLGRPLPGVADVLAAVNAPAADASAAS